ncbi:hypothetical protein ACFX15_042011 [Malus domestica]
MRTTWPKPAPSLLSQPCLPTPRLPATIDLAPWLTAMPTLPCGSCQPSLKKAHDETPNDGTIIMGAAHYACTLMRGPQAVRILKQIAKHDLAG